MELSQIFLTLAALFLAGLAADTLGRKTRLPRVTLLLVVGLVAGGAGFDLLPEAADAWYPFLSVTALTMVAFLLGSALNRADLLRHGWEVLVMSLCVVGVTLAVLTLGLIAIGADPALALVLAALATATDPAATLDVIAESGVDNRFTRKLREIVAVDDAWGLIAFSIALAGVGLLDGAAPGAVIRAAVWELAGAVLLGLAVGLPAAFLTGRIRSGDPLSSEALGIVFLTAGLSVWAGVSFLVAGMTAGAVIVNLARHHGRAFHEIEHLEWPFMILFFILAGASLDVAAVMALGALGLAYMALRIVGRLMGGAVGAAILGTPAAEGTLMGAALLPQAGVAVGMALVAGEVLPDLAGAILTITVASTVVFEIIGPLVTRWSVGQSRGRDPAEP